MGHGWYVALVVIVLASAFFMPRRFAQPERHPWRIWIPAAGAVTAILYGLGSQDWIFVGIFGFGLAVEVWRTLPIWRALRQQKEQETI